MSATKIWNGTAWVDLVGPQGPAGPTVVSSDPNNVCRLGTDGKLLVAQADLDPLYVNLSGDTMTGALTTPALTVTGNITSTGAAHSFATGSIESTAVGPLRIVDVGGDYVLQASDSGKVVIVTTDDAATVRIPASSLVDFPVGTIIEVVDNARASVIVAASVGVVLEYSIGFAGVYYRRGGERAASYISGVLCSVKLIKRAQDVWWALGNVSDVPSPKGVN